LIVEGYVASNVLQQKNFCSFIIRSSKINRISKKINIKASWFKYDPCKVLPGQLWQFTLRLKPIVGVVSPGANNYELTALVNNIHANAYVKNIGRNNLISDHWYNYSLLRLQSHLWTGYKNLCHDCSHQNIIGALIFGFQADLPRKVRAYFSEMGIIHLLVISGLHVGMIATITSFFITSILKLFPRISFYMPIKQYGLISGTVVSLIYAAISGFGAPALRSSTMLVFLVLSKVNSLNLSYLEVLLLAALLQIIIWPPVAWGLSFQLSFLAVLTIIIITEKRVLKRGFYDKYIRSQITLTLALCPLLVSTWFKLPTYGFFLNFVAIPIFTIFIVPLAFIACMHIDIFNISYFAAHFVDHLLEYSLSILEFLNRVPHRVTYFKGLSWLSYLSMWFVPFLFMLPKGFPARNIFIFFLLPLMFSRDTNDIKFGEFKVNIIDVGQGLSILVQTKFHNILFDTGPSYQSGFSAGESIVLPYLYYLGVEYLDDLIISHPDSDHIGGMNSLLKALDVKRGFANNNKIIPLKLSKTCHSGFKWNYDGVYFKFLWPNSYRFKEKNNNSCVLKVYNRYNSILIPGDIEKKAESKLVSDQLSNLKSDILIAPHHGSKGSSSKLFVNTVRPEKVIFSTGKINRFSFPHRDTLKRYECSSKVSCMNTANTGTIVIGSNKGRWNFFSYRNDKKYLWQQFLHSSS
ncbi:MAG: DNA internalization-related competence protein ComEC/Rec2, partial [Pseudomonadota bacterium]|nr:DNA internalization-related competence protein ComEC/Rec2 [Pseudomonadota bacterium]